MIENYRIRAVRNTDDKHLKPDDKEQTIKLVADKLIHHISEKWDEAT